VFWSSVGRRGNYGVDTPIVPVTQATLAVVMLELGARKINDNNDNQGWWLVGAGAILLCIAMVYVHAARRGKFLVWSDVLGALQLRGDEKILDMGCGRGAVSTLAAARVPSGSVLGVDSFRVRSRLTSTRGGTEDQIARRNATLEGVAERVTFTQADVRALNPNLSGLSTVYTQVSPADALASGAKDGDPDFTRNRSFFLGITSAGDCTGLKSFQVLNGISGTIPAGGYANAVALPGDNSAGSKQITVIVSDALGNPGTYNRTLYYDPDKPTLNGGSVSGSSGNTVIRTLTFSGVSVNDALYGQVRNLPAGRQFWGVWIANANLSATPNITPDNPGLNWAPVKIQSPNAAFTVQWSLFSGLDYAPDGTHAGSYRVFVRFLDGAGNPTDGVLTANVTLAQGYDIPTNYMPLIRR